MVLRWAHPDTADFTTHNLKDLTPRNMIYYDPINIVDYEEKTFYGHDDIIGEQKIRPSLDLDNHVVDRSDYLILRD